MPLVFNSLRVVIDLKRSGSLFKFRQSDIVITLRRSIAFPSTLHSSKSNMLMNFNSWSYGKAVKYWCLFLIDMKCECMKTAFQEARALINCFHLVHVLMSDNWRSLTVVLNVGSSLLIHLPAPHLNALGILVAVLGAFVVTLYKGPTLLGLAIRLTLPQN
ncbi:hypothetical protein V2J09_013609 [Rumex salicifolius]